MIISSSNESRESSSASSIDKLMTAHNEIIKAWFSHWSDQERSRIDLTFDRRTLASDRHPA